MSELMELPASGRVPSDSLCVCVCVCVCMCVCVLKNTHTHTHRDTHHTAHSSRRYLHNNKKMLRKKDQTPAQDVCMSSLYLRATERKRENKTRTYCSMCVYCSICAYCCMCVFCMCCVGPHKVTLCPPFAVQKERRQKTKHRSACAR